TWYGRRYNSGMSVHRLKRIIAVAAFFCLTAGAGNTADAAAASCTSVQDALNANKTAAVVTCVPAGTTSIEAAESTAGTGGTTKYKAAILKPEVGQSFTPKTAGYPWVGMIAKNGTTQVGNWPPRLQT